MNRMSWMTAVAVALVVGVFIGQALPGLAGASAAVSPVPVLAGGAVAVGAGEGITDATAVKFSDEQIRVAANTLASAYWTCKQIQANYYANPSLGTAYTTGIAETIVDGSAVDGRLPITGNHALGVITRASEFTAGLEADNNAKLNTILSVAVNGRSAIQ